MSNPQGHQVEDRGTRDADNQSARPTRTIVSDLAFGESARWHEDRVWFCDWVDGNVISINPDGTGQRVHAHLEGGPISIAWSPQGTLRVVDGGGHRLLGHDADGLSPVADLSQISDRTWNEIAVHPSGRTYVNGIGFDMMAGEPPATGQIAVVEADGTVRQVADGLEFPNGMAISRDGGTLVVAESYAGRLTGYTITDDGSLTDRRTFAYIEGSAPDGICFTDDGSIWYADVPNQHCRRVAEGGDILDTIEVDRGCFSCALSPNGVLYIVAMIWDEDIFTSRSGVVLAVDVDHIDSRGAPG